MSHSALIIGAQGVLGTFIARTFSEAGWEVLRTGRRPESAPDFRLLDLDDPAAVSQACREANVVVNTARHNQLSPERTVLREGGILIDLIELPRRERGLLVSEEPEAHGLVVADTGLGGVAYLAVADLLREHAHADAAEYSLMISASGSTGRAGALFGHTLLSDSAHHRVGRVPFPQPFGARRCIEVAACDSGVLRQAVGTVPIRHYLCMQPRALQRTLLALNGARLMRILPAAAFTSGSGEVPSKPSDERICEWVGVSSDGQRLAAQTLEGRGYYRMTAASTLAFAEALTQARNGRRGLLSIDELVTLEVVRPTLAEMGITVCRQSLEEKGK